MMTMVVLMTVILILNYCSYQRQSDKTSQMLKMRQTSGGGGGGGGGGGVGGLQQSKGDKNLNLINNNRSR